MPKTLSTYPICHFGWIPHKFLGAVFRIRADSHLNNKSERVASDLNWTVILTINLSVYPIFKVSPKIKWTNAMARHFMTSYHILGQDMFARVPCPSQGSPGRSSYWLAFKTTIDEDNHMIPYHISDRIGMPRGPDADVSPGSFHESLVLNSTM